MSEVTVKFKTPAQAYLRNGTSISTGLHIWADTVVTGRGWITISSITSRDRFARGYLEIPVADLLNVIQALERFLPQRTAHEKAAAVARQLRRKV